MIPDLDLLEIEIETLWVVDGRSRRVRARTSQEWPAPHLVIASSCEGQIVAIGSEVPDALAIELKTAVAGEPPSPDPATPPASTARCAQLLRDTIGDVELSSGPSFVIPPTTAFESTAAIQRSDSANIKTLSGQNPVEANWSAEEWRLLLDGTLGPWAIATVGDQVVSICHTARLADRGAEAGVWTGPDFRGQGHAAAVTAARASLLAPTGRTFSTAPAPTTSRRNA